MRVDVRENAMILALSTLCENPRRKTGLTTLFHELVQHSLILHPEVSWIVFADPQYEWTIEHPNVRVIRSFRNNHSLPRRLFADHVLVPLTAKRMKASALLTVGFVPLLKTLPTPMHLNVLTHLSGNDKLGPWRTFYRKWMMDRGLRRAELVITNSLWAADQITKYAPWSRARLVVSYEGLDHSVFHPQQSEGEQEGLQREFGISPGYFLWVSNFYPYKQADLLLKAYARCSPEMRKNHPMVMVGGSFGHGETIRKLVMELGIQDDVKFLGWIADQWLAPLYRSAIAHCFASREETFGRSVSEALACGTPCVLNDIPIMREVSGGQALLLNFQDLSAVSEALEDIVSNPELRERLRLGGFQEAARFRFDTLAGERMDAILALLNSEQTSKRRNLSAAPSEEAAADTLNQR
ncbi:MAG TPA: glycosyltransferase family 1 protein [Bryobacteraceae bacterium]|jgi:glycosyltransferase involved in cell wall biosynthesis|nr:glycosyltransferase family 1 protein [Bryobacteraceae bacterium]